MIQAAEADIIGPAVSAEDPHGFLRQEVLVGQGLLCKLADLAVISGGLFQLSDQSVGSNPVSAGIVKGINILSASLLHGLVVGLCGDLVDIFSQSAADSLLTQSHTETELGVILEQRVLPSRAMALLIYRIRSRRRGAAPNGGTAGSVGDKHSVAKQLGSQLGVRSLAAAGAGAGELEQGLLELAALHGGFLKLGGNLGLLVQSTAVIKDLLAGTLGIDRLHNQSLLTLHARAYLSAGTAAGAVQGGNGHNKLHAGYAGHILGLSALGSGGQLVGGHSHRTDNGMGTYIRAEVALNTVLRIPLRNVYRDTALFKGGRALRSGAVHMRHKGGNRQLVALIGVDRVQHVVDILLQILSVGGNQLLLVAGAGVLPGGGNLYLMNVADASFDGGVVHGDDLLALLGIGLGGGVLHILNGVSLGNDVGDFKERGLENGIDAASQTDFLTDLDTVDGIQVNIVVGDELLHLAGQPLIQLLHIPGTVQKEVSALLQILNNVILVYIRGVVAGYEVSLADIIGGFDRLMTETQVGYSQAAGLLGVVGEVALSVHIGVVADDLDGVLVSAYGAVRTQAPELTGMGSGGSGVRVFLLLQGQMGHIVHNANGEPLLGGIGLHVAVHGDDLSRSGILGAQAVTAGVNRNAPEGSAGQSGQNIQIQRLADRARLLGSVKNRNGLHGGRNHIQQIFGNEGAV